MRKFSKREKFLIGAFIVVLVIYIVSTYWITPLMEKIDELKKQQAELKIQWEEIKNWIGHEDQLQQQISNMEAEVNELVERIPSAEQSALYWNAFNLLARETGVEITRMVEQTGAGGTQKGGQRGAEIKETAEGTATDSGPSVAISKTWQVTLDVSGPERSIMEFSNRLQNMTYVTAVKTGTFTYQDASVLATYELVLAAR
jgi:hypothetical protein